MKKAKTPKTVAEVKTSEDFAIGELVHDMPRPRLNKPLTADDIFGNKAAEEAMDALEQRMGLKPVASKMKQANLKYLNVLLSPGIDKEDQQLLNELLNDREQFLIIRVSDSWTARGDYRIFVIYAEDLDVKARRAEEKKKKAQETNP